jgi:hypothetical protein
MGANDFAVGIETVYCRTADGEDAVRRRALLVQQHLRRTLEQVDGVRDVATLAAAFDDPAVARIAIRELASLGLIEAAAIAHARQTTRSALARAETSARTASAHQADALIEEITIAALEDVRPAQAKAGAVDAAARAGGGAPSARRAAPVRARPAGAARRVLTALGRVIVATGLLTVAAATMLAGGLLLYPYEHQRARLEVALSSLLDAPVSIGRLHFAASFPPALEFDDVRIGAAGELRVREVQASADPMSLLRSGEGASGVVLRDLDVDVAKLATLFDWRLRREGVSLQIDSLRFENATLRIGDLQVARLRGDAQVDADGSIGAIVFARDDGAFSGRIVRRGEALALRAHFFGWQAPTNPAMTFDELEIEGVIEPNAIRIDRVQGRIWDGSLDGRLRLAWGEAAQLSGDFEFAGLNARKLFAELMPEVVLHGEVAGRLGVVQRADNLAGFGDGARVTGEFLVSRGVLAGVDLVEAARTRAGRPVQGGGIQFDRFGGSLDVQERAWRIGGIELVSGPLRATGSMRLEADRAAHGRLDVSVSGSAARIDLPVRIEGTIRDPRLVVQSTAARPDPAH